MLRLAREACAAGRRVWWVGLPAQRGSVYRRATLEPAGPDAAGDANAPALLGLEFLTLQQVCYRLLARARELRPLVIGSGRLVLVGEALAEVAGAVPAPGEARLFAQAIAEAKRFAVTPAALVGAPSEAAAAPAGSPPDPRPRAERRTRPDAERSRLATVFAAYERLKAAAGGDLGDAWDYDDFRAAAVALAERDPRACEAEVLVVDGFRELGPLELRLFRALAEAVEVHVTLPAVPEGPALADAEVTPVAPGAPGTQLERYRAPNPVAEARWALRSLKRDLAEGGFEPLELALIAPPERIPALAALADEYGVPLVDETPRALADTPAGRVLVELLELPDYPTPSGVLAVPELAPLAAAALTAGVAGSDAMGALAAALGLEAPWRAWLAALEVGGEPLAWARHLLAEVLPRLLGEGHGNQAHPGGGSERGGSEGDGAPGGEALPAGFQQQALQAAQEASRLAGGAGFRAWWAALLRQGRLQRDLPGGVALVTATLASGRRFGKAYLLGANEGVYGAGEREDYFVPEEDRVEPAAGGGLPRRFQGRDPQVIAELLARAGRLVVTFPEADQGGPLLAEPALAGRAPSPLPEVPAGSALELPAGADYVVESEPVALGEPTVAALRRYQRCGFRLWGERRLGRGGERPWWAELRAALLERPQLTAERLEVLAAGYPEAADWLRGHAERLTALSYGVRLPAGEESGVRARVDAAVRGDGLATLVRFCAPDRVSGQAEAESYVKERWTELWAAGHLLERYPRQVRRVDVTVWPLLGEPIDVFERGIGYRWKQIQRREQDARAAYRRFARGEVEPRPGYHCRDCPVADVCRKGRS